MAQQKKRAYSWDGLTSSSFYRNEMQTMRKASPVHFKPAESLPEGMRLQLVRQCMKNIREIQEERSVEWEELRSLHLGSSRGSEAEAFPSSPPEHQRKSQLKYLLGWEWRNGRLRKHSLVLPSPHSTPTLPTRGQNSSYVIQNVNYSEKKKKKKTS